MKKEIIPAVMPDSYEDLTDKISRVSKLVDWVQIDVMDGKFVKSKSWPYDKYKYFEEMVEQEEGLPHWEELNFSIDLMVDDPKKEATKWIEAGASRVIIHIESLRPKDEEFLKELKENGTVEVCLALSPKTETSDLDKYKGLYDSVQFMGIQNVGYQGEPFVEEVLDKIKDFHEKNKDIPIGIDGGVSFDNIEDLDSVGVSRFVSGSVLFNSIDMEETLDEMRGMLE